MPPLNQAITGYVSGNDFRITRNTVSNIPAGTTLSKAYLTIKTNLGDPDPGLVQLSITTALTSAGQITDNGSGGGSNPVGTGALFFVLSKAQTLALGFNRVLNYDILLIFSDGTDATFELGDTTKGGGILFRQGVTLATS